MMSISLEDRLAIHELINLHGHLFDNALWHRIAEIFTADVVYDIEAFGAGRLNGIEAIKAAALSLGESNPLAHHVTNIVLSEDATGQVTVLSKGLGLQLDGRLGSVTYHDLMRREPNGWRIAQRRVTPRKVPIQP
jgi:SnoaL-like domain